MGEECPPEETSPLTATPKEYGTTFDQDMELGSEAAKERELTTRLAKARTRLEKARASLSVSAKGNILKNQTASGRSLSRSNSLSAKFVPTLLTDNLRLVTDPHLDLNEHGKLYYLQNAFYNNSEAPEYALTVHPDIFKQVLIEMDDAQNMPFGMYFCCHGGDGAHTGIKLDDHVDIRVAFFLVGLIMLFLIIASTLLSWTDYLVDDDMTMSE
eukprot:scaffold56580_cov52-Attheya_sp.AAC.5